MQIDAFASRLSFFFNVHNNFFEEVAKFRAARRLWAKIMKERFGAKDERSMMMRFHAQTAGSTLTAQQVDNNVVRVTMQALAAVLGGAQSLHTNSKDEALALPTESSVLLALRTQQLIAHEIGRGGHDRSARRFVLRRAAHQRNRKEGASSTCRRSTTSAARSRQSSAATCSAKFRTRHLFTSARLKRSSESSSGSTSLLRAASRPGDILRVKPELEEKQKASVARVRAERNAEAAAKALARVEAAARDGQQPDAADRRCGARMVHAGRDFGRDAQSVRRVSAGEHRFKRGARRG